MQDQYYSHIDELLMQNLEFLITGGRLSKRLLRDAQEEVVRRKRKKDEKTLTIIDEFCDKSSMPHHDTKTISVIKLVDLEEVVKKALEWHVENSPLEDDLIRAWLDEEYNKSEEKYYKMTIFSRGLMNRHFFR